VTNDVLCISKVSRNYNERPRCCESYRRYGDRLIACPCLLYFFYRNVQWGRWFTYLHYVLVPVTVCTCVRIGCAPRLRCRGLLRRRRPSFPAVLTCIHLFATVWREVTWPPLCSNWCAISRHFSNQMLNKNRQCCKSWRDAELGVRAVCAVGDTTDEDRWIDLLCCLSHCDIAERCLANDTLTTFSSSSDCYDDWRRPSPTVRSPSYDASSPLRQCRLLRSCSNASAA